MTSWTTVWSTLFDHYYPSEYFTTVYGCWKTFWTFLETKTDLSEAQKTTVSRLSKPIIGASFFKKWQILHFPAIKTDWWVVGCSNYYQSTCRVIRKWKHMHILGLWRLDLAESASESHCKHFKKSFFWGQSHTKSLSKIWFSTKCEFIFKSSLKDHMTSWTTVWSTLFDHYLFDHYYPNEYFTTVYGCWKTF